MQAQAYPDRYGRDALAVGHRRAVVADVPGEPDLVVECASTGFCGAIVGWDKTATGWAVVLEDRRGRRRLFPPEPAGFLLDGRPVSLVRPPGAAGSTSSRAGGGAPPGPARNRSGSLAGAATRARVARESRIWVEGRHDAELVELVWGQDLREAGVVVEMLDGIDGLLDRVAGYDPGPTRRLVVIVDHLVPGSKETRIAAGVQRAHAPFATVLGHPYVDVWAAVKPGSVGISAWPEVPRGISWKSGVCAALGWPDDERAAWQRILASVHSYADLDPALIGRVEQAIDLVTEDGLS